MREKAHTVSLGSSPRVFPRPEYPSFIKVLLVQGKAMLWVTGVLGTLLTLWGYPLWQESVGWLQSKGYSEALVFTILLNGSHTILWLIVNLPLLYFDANGLMQQYKLHRNPGQIASDALYKESIITAIFGQLLLNPIVGYYIHSHWTSLGLLSVNTSLPSYQEIFKSLVIGHAFNDVFFYITHRIFHSRSLYWIHKQHHTFAGTIGPAAEFANPIEILIANIFPTFYGNLFFGTKHPYVLLIWVSLRLQETWIAHSGYSFNGTILDYIGFAHTNETAHHDHHHTSNRGNFGCLFMDWCFGTMDFYADIGCEEGYLKKGKGNGNDVDTDTEGSNSNSNSNSKSSNKNK